VDVTVRGQSGVWQESGITYSMITDSLPEDEMLKVAESLR
jgi:hypothetical protein